MLRKSLLFFIIFAILIAFFNGIFSVSFSPLSISIQKSEKDFLKKAARKIKNIIYRGATKHNPSGDVLPDKIDDKLKQKLKEKIN